jgi:acyl-CoA synthetase (AMP-forming)/AMP-acid ligase II
MLSYILRPVVLPWGKHPEITKFDLSNLRMMTSGAAPLTQELIEAAYARIKFSTKQDYRLSETSLLRTRSFVRTGASLSVPSADPTQKPIYDCA